MRRMQIRITEITVELDEHQLEQVLERALTGSEALLALPPAPAATNSDATPTADVIAEPRTEGKRIRQSRQKKAAGPAAPRTSAQQGERTGKIAEIIKDDRQYEQYYRALGGRTEPGERAMLIVHLAEEHFGLKGLRSAEITRILADKFSIAVQEPSIRMSLMRLGKVKPPVLAPAPVDGGKAYWLTSDGKKKVAAWL